MQVLGLTLKYWRLWSPVLGLVLLYLLFKLVVFPYHYDRGYEAAKTKYEQQKAEAVIQVQKEVAEATKRQAEQSHKASVNYQTSAAEQRQKEKVRYVEVQKIVKQPVYLNICIDDDGLRLINESAKDYKPAAR